MSVLQSGEQMQKFGEKLFRLRKQHGMTMRELASALNTTYGYISDLESGRRKPSLELGERIAELFNVSLDQLAKDSLDLDGV